MLDLDPDQLDAAYSDPCRPLLVLAHAGTGKTRTLVERLLYLHRARHAGSFGGRSGGAVTALTFTRAAMGELHDRLAVRTGGDLAGFDIRTFHSLGLALYSNWAREHDQRSSVQVATRAQSLQAATAAVRAAGLDLPPHLAAQLIADAKLGLPIHRAEPAVAYAALALHDDLLARRGLLHVHDLLVRPLRLLATVPALRRDLQERVACVVADEAQDWSPYQAALFAYLAGPEGHGTACGDPRQAIFGGSSPRFLLEFPVAYPHTKVVTLRTTYRLTGPLFALSCAIANQIPGGALSGRVQHPDGPLPVVHIAATRSAEAAWIAGYLADLHRCSRLSKWGEAVVLARTRAQGARLAVALRHAGLPAVWAADLTRSPHPAVSAVLAWLTLLRDPDDAAALLGALEALPGARHHRWRATLTPTGPWSLPRLRQEQPAALSDRQRRALAGFLRLDAGLRILAETESPTVVVDALLERSGLGTELRQAGGANEAIAALRTLLLEHGDVGLLDQWLGEEPASHAEDVVQVHTIHGYKGREARAVVVAGVEEGLLPHPAVLRTGSSGLEEELRTFYVACTRSREHEALTAAWEPEAGQPAGGPSRFFHLLHPRLVRIA